MAEKGNPPPPRLTVPPRFSPGGAVTRIRMRSNIPPPINTRHEKPRHAGPEWRRHSGIRSIQAGEGQVASSSGKPPVSPPRQSPGRLDAVCRDEWASAKPAASACAPRSRSHLRASFGAPGRSPRPSAGPTPETTPSLAARQDRQPFRRARVDGSDHQPACFFQASIPPSIWRAEFRPASRAACTAIAERSPNAQ
jgi:hypothetical protein